MTAAPQSNRSIDRSSRTTSTETGSGFFVNNKPVDIDERRPTVRSIIKAAGYEAERCRVYKLSAADDPKGIEVSLDERLEATAEKPIYLRCENKRDEPTGVAPGTAGGLVGDMNRPLNVNDLGPSRPRDYARDVDQDPPGGPPRPM